MAPRTSFYSFTTQFSKHVGNAGSFVWASYAGLWHLREKALEFGKVSSAPDWHRISDHLIGAAPVAGGVDLRELVSSPWSETEASFCEQILTQGAISYEEWCVELARMTQVPGKKVKAETYQFPSRSKSSKWTNWSELDLPGVLPASPFLEVQVRPGLMAAFASNVRDLDALLHWYRHFKELRNAVAHHGGIARVENESAYAAANVVPLISLGIGRNYTSLPPVAGTRISLSVGDAALFLAVIQRLAPGFDAKYCHTIEAEIYLEKRVQTMLTNARPPGAATREKTLKWINGLLSRGLHIQVASLDAAEKWLRGKNLLSTKTQLI